jgi:hypothetical protein
VPFTGGYQLEVLSALEGVAALQGHGVVVAHEGLEVADVLELHTPARVCESLLGPDQPRRSARPRRSQLALPQGAGPRRGCGAQCVRSVFSSTVHAPVARYLPPTHPHPSLSLLSHQTMRCVAWNSRVETARNMGGPREKQVRYLLFGGS